jgi:hypothetical protein
MSWFYKIIAIGPALLAYGSTGDKAMRRALGDDGAMEDIAKAVAIVACNVTGLEQYLGRPNIMVVKTSADSSHDQIFAFDSIDARDKFMQLLQVSILCSVFPPSSRPFLEFTLLLIHFSGPFCITSSTPTHSCVAPACKLQMAPYTPTATLLPPPLFPRDNAVNSSSRTASTTGSL